MEDLELYVDTLRNAVIRCLDGGQDLREGDWATGDVNATHVEVFVSVEETGPHRGIPRVLRGLAGVQRVLCIYPPVIV